MDWELQRFGCANLPVICQTSNNSQHWH